MSDDQDPGGRLDYRLPAMQIDFDHGQFYPFGDPSWRELPDSPQLRALDDAWERQAGGVDGLIVVLCPADFHFDAVVDLEVWTGEPPLEQDDHDHIVDIDLDVPHGVVYVQASEAPELAWAAWLRTPRPYRVRVDHRSPGDIAVSFSDRS